MHLLVNPAEDSKEKILPRPRRGPSKIILEILAAASGDGTTKTALVYKSRLSFNRVDKYISFLLAEKLLECRGTALRIYRTTLKGEEVRQMLAALEEFLFGEDAEKTSADNVALGW